jgi:hypothetical protein
MDRNPVGLAALTPLNTIHRWGVLPRTKAEECAMKLNSTQVERTLSQFEAEALPADHPAVEQLNELFGEHTFFLDLDGLHIVTPVEPDRPGTEAGQIVKLASWKDSSRTSLAPHDPELTDIVILLAA